MKTDIVWQALFAIMFVFFGIFLGSIIADSRNPPPKFHYKDRVLVIDGFYKGESGVVNDMNTFSGKNKYYIEGGKGFINEDDLQLQ